MHSGLSGPAVLQSSSHWEPGGVLEIDLLPGVELAAELRAGSKLEARPIAAGICPKRGPPMVRGTWILECHSGDGRLRDGGDRAVAPRVECGAGWDRGI
jgi:hypothetical protein